ncbi:hypothetical protein PCANC_06865 [Puccinia coronata f. sp. avenae]|uniref:DUF6818 domain-containing protein n=1 Tax=Puccinia coronata f. sp. avenae TaxID=200324 RepID=A0A2N5VVE2_9BASI|nr:hypothetical protein PCANC_06865 [Puccinia coronata f. sp. avenae]
MDIIITTTTTPTPIPTTATHAIPRPAAASQTRPLPPIRQTRPGRAAGSQGYSVQDMVVLAECVSEVLPLGTTEWNSVLSRYNAYASRAGRAQRAYHSLRTKFRSIVLQPIPPTGLLEDSPRYVQQAKRAARAIEERSRSLLSQNPNWAESDEETGVPAQVPARSATVEDEQELTQANVDMSTTGTTTQANPPTTQQADHSVAPPSVINPSLANQPLEEQARSSASPGMISTASLHSVARSGTSPARTAAAWSAARSPPRLPSTSLHSLRPNHFSPLGSRARQDLSSKATAGLGARRGVRGVTNGDTNEVPGHLDPGVCSSSNSSVPTPRERELDRGLVEFYLMKLQEANETIIRLQDESSRTKEAHAARLQGLEEENRRLRDSLLQQSVRAECTQGQLEMMNRLWELSKASAFSFFQPGVPHPPAPTAPPQSLPNFPSTSLQPSATLSALPNSSLCPDSNQPSLPQQPSSSSLPPGPDSVSAAQLPSSIPAALLPSSIPASSPAHDQQHLSLPPPAPL